MANVSENIPGLIPQKTRWYGWRPSKPDFRDEAFRYAPTIARLPKQASLAYHFLPPIGQQGSQGSCTGWATARACDYLRAKDGQDRHVVLSPRFAYWLAREIEGTTREDAGAELRDVIKGIKRYGCASMRTCPYREDDFKTPPSPLAFAEGRLDILKEYCNIDAVEDRRVTLVKQAIFSQFPVVFGFSVYTNFEAAEVGNTGLMPMPDGALIGGHAVWSDRYDDDKKVLSMTGAVRVVNSWGTAWGERGYFWMPYEFLKNPKLCADFWVLKGIT